MLRIRENEIADALTTADIWQIMLREVPPIAAEYFIGGADELTTLKANVLAFQQTMLAPPGAIKHKTLDTTTNIFGQQLSLPFFVSPVGSLRTLWPMADAVASQVAGDFGTAMTLSTLSQTPMEAVADASSGPKWFQLYLCGGVETAKRGIRRARDAGFSALVLTIDTAVSGKRIAHDRMKPMDAVSPIFSGPGKLRRAVHKVKLAPQIAPRTSWLWRHWRDGGMLPFVNVIDEHGSPMPYAGIGEQLAASAVTWSDLPWIQERWGEQPLIVKGVHCADDALQAEELGATGVIFSNHGGRQLGQAIPSLQIVAEAMPKLRAAQSKLDCAMDGGIRSGLDVLIGLSYGLKAVGLGRVTAGGLGAGGHLGLTRAFELMKEDLLRSMELLGVQNISQIQKQGEKLRRESMLLSTAHLPGFVF